MAVISTILSRSFIPLYFCLIILLWIPSSILFISVYLFFSSSGYLLNISCIFSIFASILFPRSWIIFTITTSNSFSGRLPISTSFSCSGVLSCSFVWKIFVCFCGYLHSSIWATREAPIPDARLQFLVLVSVPWWVRLVQGLCRLPGGETGACPLVGGAESCLSV